ncbi:MAG: GAF domain-containing protein, partial [Nitrospirota bacterium]
MTMPAPQSKQNAETHLQRTLNTALNELGTDSALAAIFHQEQGPLVGHATRGFTPRDVQAILRTLSTQAAAVQTAPQDQDAGRTIRLRLITPGAKSLLGMPLRHRQRTYGFLVIARKENATFAKKEKGLMEQAGDDITKALEREGLFDMNVVLSRPYVSREPAPAAPAVSEIFSAPTAQFTPELEEKIVKVLE